MFEMFQLPFMLQALVACVLLSLLLPYFGIHVVKRGIVFIDLALAQISALGAAFAMLIHQEPIVFSVLFTIVAALVFSMVQVRHTQIHQEAFIGIVYAVASAMVMMILSKVPHDDADISAMLFGNILAVSEAQVIQLLILFVVIGGVHFFIRQQLWQLSLTMKQDNASEKRSRFLNFVFYITLALVISMAIRIAGVLLVFTYLIVPAVLALLFAKNIGRLYLLAIGFGIVASVLGLFVSYNYDFPTGASIVTVFGIVFLTTSLTGLFKSSG